MKLNKKQIDIIDQTISVPLMAFGLSKFTEKINEDNLQKIKKLLEEIKISNEIKKEDIHLCLKAFIVARDIIDEREYQTITGFTWEESLDLILFLID